MSRLINAFEQYFDTNGEPLVSGLLDFFESGSSTVRKETYADLSETIPNSNPVVLGGDGRAPNIFGPGSYNVILRTAGGTQILARDPIGGIGGVTFGANWNAATTYLIGNVVFDNNIYYQSLITSNLNFRPSTDDLTRWVPVIFTEADSVNNSGKIYDTVAQMQAAADSFLVVGQSISTKERTAGAGGGANYLVAAAQTVDELGNLTLSSGRVALIQNNIVTLAMMGGNSRTGTKSAYNLNKKLSLSKGESAILECNPTAGDDIQDMSAWIRTIIRDGEPDVFIELTDGVHTVSTYIDVDGSGNTVDIRASLSPDFIQITAYSFTDVSGTIRQVSATVASALPSGAVVGGPIAIQNAQGSLDIECANGCQMIKAIAGDRLSFTYEIQSVVGVLSNGVLDNTLTYGLTANQAVIFKSALICQSSGWDGGAREGFINVLNGGRMDMRNLGLVYSGSAGTEHDMIFARGEGSRFHALDRVGVVGGGDKVTRSYGGGEIYFNRSYLGGGNTALEIFQGVAGGGNQFIRCSIGSAGVGGFTCGHASTVNVAQSAAGALGIAFRTTAAGAFIAAYPVRIKKSTTAMLATAGAIFGTTATELSRNTLAVDFAAGGVVTGNFTMGASAEANTSDSDVAGNTFHKGGVWFKDTAANGSYEELLISGATPKLNFADGVSTSSINGNSGNVQIDSYTAGRDIILSAAGVTRWTFDMGGTVNLLPATDNAQDLGSASFRMQTIYAGTGTINTSDDREKTYLDFIKAENLAAKEIRKNMRKFQFNDAINLKGGKSARVHFGSSAQQVRDILISHKLNPNSYGFLCYDEWEDVLDEDGNIIREKGNRYGIRYDELLCFIISAM